MVISHCIKIMVTAETVELQQLQLTETFCTIPQKLPSLITDGFLGLFPEQLLSSAPLCNYFCILY